MNTHRITSRAGRVLLLGLIAVLPGLPALAGVAGDLRAGGYTDAEAAMIGGGALVDLEPSHHWYFNPNLELAFPDSADLVTVNGDFHYDFPGSPSTAFWVGGGPALRFVDPDFGEDDTDVGANVLAGLGARRGNVRPFGQVKVMVADDSEAAIMAGIRF